MTGRNHSHHQATDELLPGFTGAPIAQASATPLQKAMECGKREVAALLLAHGANPSLGFHLRFTVLRQEVFRPA